MMKNTSINQQKKRGCDVIIVDDDEAILDSTKLLLEHYGYTVYIVNRAESVFDVVKKHPPKSILLDVWMSGKSGTEICKKMKRDKKMQNIPIILFSASEKIKEDTKVSGADGYLKKPFRVQDLIGVIDEHTSKNT